MNREPHPIPAATFAGAATQLGLLVVAAGTTWASGAGQPHHAAAVGFAAGTCAVGAVGGWLAARWPGTTPAARVSRALGVIGLRIFPALVALAWLQTRGGELRVAGAGGMLVAFYLVALAADVILNIMGSRGTRPPPGSKSEN